VYSLHVKRSELERKLRELGWYFLKDGGKHAVWAHPVKPHKIYVPRHPTINMNTARAILREAAK
jgi:predicted RNA binding protein YcfA (HicA-like mRNA interferase family)